ncbi:hypothetical protein BGY98DRAFT_979402 [Russula aff. rugulosa BPL654]|nr:hypothetical protein BGY98DRAFT_979402 [Russula aff. rugulosa BPL654]
MRLICACTGSVLTAPCSVTRVHPQPGCPAQQLAIRQQHGTSAAFPAIVVAANTAKIQFQVQIRAVIESISQQCNHHPKAASQTIIYHI